MLSRIQKISIKNKLSPLRIKNGWEARKTEIDMTDIYEQATHNSLRMTPGGYIGKCPFPDHDDNTPSFVMYPDTQSYYCFGCRKSGSASWFKREMERIYGL